MDRPSATKKLVLYALVITGIGIFLQTLICLVPGLTTAAFGGMHVKLEPISVAFLLSTPVLRLPFAALAVWSFLQKQMKRSSALFLCIAAPVISTLFSLLRLPLGPLMLHVTSNEQYAGISVVSSVQSYLGFTHTAGLVLLCCAGAIELYLTTHTDPQKP
ncbi:MAG: hypothetical protein IJ055_01465 [Oscillospiraceae bacterium]|nr:hypothetical protein [Oscillospiraceae bacterium]